MRIFSTLAVAQEGTQSSFLSRGYQVDAIDGSEQLCRIASEYTGIKVRQMLFQELDEKENMMAYGLVHLFSIYPKNNCVKFWKICMQH